MAMLEIPPRVPAAIWPHSSSGGIDSTRPTRWTSPSHDLSGSPGEAMLPPSGRLTCMMPKECTHPWPCSLPTNASTAPSAWRNAPTMPSFPARSIARSTRTDAPNARDFSPSPNVRRSARWIASCPFHPVLHGDQIDIVRRGQSGRSCNYLFYLVGCEGIEPTTR